MYSSTETSPVWQLMTVAIAAWSSYASLTSDVPLTGVALVLLVGKVALILLAGLSMGKLTVHVDEREVSAELGPVTTINFFAFGRNRVELSKVASLSVVHPHVVNGYGIRFTLTGTLIRLWTNAAVRIETTDGTALMIATPDTTSLIRAIVEANPAVTVESDAAAKKSR
jgi:hypothetical protein